MQLLLEAGGAVDVFDKFGGTPIYYAATAALHESFNILAGKECILYTQLHGEVESILQIAIYVESSATYRHRRSKASHEEAEGIVDTVIGLVAKRRQILEALARTSLDFQSIKQLRMSPETLLDFGSPLAVRLPREKPHVPASLENLLPLDGTVYHIKYLNQRQAHVLWEAGFHDIDEPDSLGHSALMKRRSGGIDENLELAEWLVGKGVNLHCRQKHAFGSRLDGVYESNRASSTTALHYLASYWAGLIYASFHTSILQTNQGFENLLSSLSNLSEKSVRIFKTVLTDTLPDCCKCGCSIEGCRAYTMFVKSRILHALADVLYVVYGDDIITYAWKRPLLVTQALAQLLDVDQPSLAWLRREMIRFNTFERLDIRHTCCWMAEDFSAPGYHDVIVEPNDDEERLEIMEEQAERLDRLETLLEEFEGKYTESGNTLSEFFDGYWEDRMVEVAREEAPIDHDALENIGVTLRRTGSASSCSSNDRFEEVEESSGGYGSDEAKE